MNEKIKKFDECLCELEAVGADKEYRWNGYDVYRPESAPHLKGIIGPPWVILVKDNVARICTAREADEYHKFWLSKNGYVYNLETEQCELANPDEIKPTKTLSGLGEKE